MNRNFNYNKNPLTTEGFLPRSLFLWCNDCINTCKETPWTQEMNYDLPEFDKLSFHKERLAQNLRRHKKLLSAILVSYKKETLVLIFSQILLSLFNNYAIKVVSDSFDSVSKLSLYKNPENLKHVAFKLLGGSLLVCLANIINQNFLFYSRRISLGVRSSLFSIMQDKILRFSTLNSDNLTDGFIADLIQVDIVFLNEMYFHMFEMFGSVVGMTTSITFMAILIGLPQTAIYIAVMASLMTIFHFLYILQAWIRKHYLEAKDKRMNLLRNVLENIDYVKINGLETYFCLEMYEKREGEISWMKAQALVHSLQFSTVELLTDWIPPMVFNVVWLLFPIFGMTLAKFFAFFNYSKNTTKNLRKFLESYLYYLNMMVSVRRIDRFLGEKEKVNQERIQYDGDDDFGDEIVLRIENCSFRWTHQNGEFEVSEESEDLSERIDRETELKILGSRKIYKNLIESAQNDSESVSENFEVLLGKKKREDGQSPTFMLRDVNLSVKKGEKIGVIGRSSSGTSSLLYAMIGEMIPLDSARVYRNGTISYLSQSRWLMGASIKENILLGKPYDYDLMQMALEAADLLKDLDQFSDGIETILSDNGDSVSGGQRARIALARCFYQE